MVVSDLGQKLKEARLARGMTLDDVQELTKIRTRYLEAIEAGDYKVLPGSFYVRAFIKTYAEAVGIDPDELLTEHRQHVPDPAPEPTMEPVLQKRRSTRAAERNSKWLSTTLMWSFAVLILVVIYMYFSVWGKSDEIANNDQPDPTRVTNNSEVGSGNSGNGANNDTNSNPGNNAGTDTPVDPGDTGTDNAGSSNNQGGNNSTEQGSIIVAQDGKEGSTTKFIVQAPANAQVPVVITASGRSWVEVRKGDKSGEKLFYDTMESGDVLNYDLGAEGLFIKSGASPNTVITVAEQVVEDGKTTSRIQLNLGEVPDSEGNEENGANSTTNTTGE
ncbi:RodZ domain-containing protein [Paenibacillus brevis]|uniref:RodZ domain-containing protein n=1 Tax=Paenibacillus brevis TaxID=2841508 RepID=UPI003D2ECEEC